MSRLATQPAAGPDPHRAPEYASRYEEDRYGGGIGGYLKRYEIGLFEELVRDTPGSVLDVGTGTGKLAFALAHAGRPVTACDRSLPMVAEASGRAGGARDVRLVVAAAERLCFPSRSFGVVVSSRVMMHVSGWEEAIGELCRVAAGAVVADFPARWSAAGVDALRKRLAPRPAHSPRQTYRTFRLRDVRRAFRDAGFEVVAVRRSFCLPVALHRRLNRPAVTRAVEGLLRRIGVSRLVGSPFSVRAVPFTARPGTPTGGAGRSPFTRSA